TLVARALAWPMTWQKEWISQQIAEFLALVSACGDERSAVESAVERAAEALEAEVAAVVRDGRVASSVGYPAAHVPEADLVAAATGGQNWLPVPGVGECRTLSVPLEGTGRLLVARSGDEFTHEEAVLLRGMGRVLTLVLRTLGVLGAERHLRRES